MTRLSLALRASVTVTRGQCLRPGCCRPREVEVNLAACEELTDDAIRYNVHKGTGCLGLRRVEHVRNKQTLTPSGLPMRRVSKVVLVFPDGFSQGFVKE